MIKPIYECQKCHNTFLNNLDSHDGLELEETSGAPVLYSGNYKIIKCQGVLKPAILVDDLIEYIGYKIENLEYRKDSDNRDIIEDEIITMQEFANEVESFFAKDVK